MSEEKKLNMPQSILLPASDHRISRSLHPAEDGRTDDRTVFQLDHHLSVL